MLPTQSGSVRLTRLAGIDVYVHWSWLIVAVLEIQGRQGEYQQRLWNAAEYLTLFAIVLLHEFGHALACRQVGGTANQVVLWPLGGVAYVSPPQRPGAVLWSVAAGPLVNVLLIPVALGALLAAQLSGLADAWPDLRRYLLAVNVINGVLLVFNLLPVFPLDGGQILRSLLWFVIGPAKSLAVASGVGLVAGLGAVLLAMLARNIWFGILAVFVVLHCWNGWQTARAMLQKLRSSRREGFRCPSCGSPPPRGPFWACPHCRNVVDLFEQGAVCPQCGANSATTECPDCHAQCPLSAWTATSPDLRLGR